jgi:hypothetical protein
MTQEGKEEVSVRRKENNNEEEKVLILRNTYQRVGQTAKNNFRTIGAHSLLNVTT